MLQQKIQPILNWWSNQKTVPFILIFIALMYVGRILLLPIYFLDDSVNLHPSVSLEKSFIEMFIRVCVLTPLLETLIYQQFIIYLTEKFTTNKYLQVLFSALIFGLSHWSSIVYIVFAFFQGIVLATGFLLLKNTRGVKTAFVITSIVHAIVNSAATLLIYFD